MQDEILLPDHRMELNRVYRNGSAARPDTTPIGNGLESIGCRKDGSEFPIEVNLSTITTNRGPLAVSFVSDISQRKQAETALRIYGQQLRELAGSLLTAQEDERRRVARELHDDITQRLAFLSIELGKLYSEIAEPFEDVRARIHGLQIQTLHASNEVRRLSHGLHPAAISDFGLSIALEEFSQEFEKAQGVRIHFEGLVDDSRLDDAAATCLYRIAQESLKNAVRHGRAVEVRVTLSPLNEAMQLVVEDNGCGFPADSILSRQGLGTVSMRERIRLVNGTLRIDSQPGNGTRVIACVPMMGDSDESG